MMTRLHFLTERLSCVFRGELRQIATNNGLKLAQLETLIFLARANRYSDHLVAMTQYFRVQKGAICQTLAQLERRGLIEKRRDMLDGRVQHCRVTSKGDEIVKKAFPMPMLADRTPENDKLTDALELLLRHLQHQNGFRAFGVCDTCRHFLPNGKSAVCGLTEERLNKPEIAKICREHVS